MNFSFENIIKHIKSTIVGLLIVFACLALVYLGKADFEQISPFLISAIPFLFYGNSNEQQKTL